MPARKMRSIAKNRRGVYEKLRKQGKSKAVAARISNAGKTKAGRSAMSRKAAATRKKRKG